MARHTKQTDSVALLATGDEIRDGDILNTNSQEIAHMLFNQGVPVGAHMVTGDSIAEIEHCIRYLLQGHRALIITGGLGPTSDDLTRYALANALGRELVFDERTWEIIVKRLSSLGYDPPPETNRQQALFPEGATILPNPNGTAAGCCLQDLNQFIFMLPGPPFECLTMAQLNVLPCLQQNGFQKTIFHAKWLLFGVSEGQIAEELDALALPFDCVTGYRLWYPYIEFKLHSTNETDFNALLPKITHALLPYLIDDGKKTASQLLKEKLTTLDFPIIIFDHATGGSLEATLKSPDNSAMLFFSFVPADMMNAHHLQINITGLDEFWQNKKTAQTHLTLQLNQEAPITYDMPFRGLRVKQYAVELICRKIYDYLMAQV